MLKEFEAELLKDDWNSIRNGLEVKLCSRPRDDDGADSGKDAGGKDAVEEDKETFILCRRPGTLWVRSRKEEAIVGRFEQKIEARLVSMTARCEKQNRDPMKVEHEIGRLLGQNTRAAKLWKAYIQLTEAEAAPADSEERRQDPPDLASEGGSRVGSHLRLFSGLGLVRK